MRAKFKCQTVIKSSDNQSAKVTLAAVIDDANKSWAKHTPSGAVDLLIDNPDALNHFEEGKHYFLDFAPAPAKEADEKK